MSRSSNRTPSHDIHQDTVTVVSRAAETSVKQLTLRVVGAEIFASYPLESGKSLVLGRGQETDVRIEHTEISRRHMLLHTGPPIQVQDLGSSNGTTVRGSRLESFKPAEINAGEAIRIGSLILLLQWDETRAQDDHAAAVGRAPAMVKLYEMVDRVAPSRINVLLHGETGAGKEVLAEAIHARSTRSDKPFLRLNCGGFSETLLESELFGHEKGAFTGATHTKPGLLECAEGGTVLLDEIGELPLSLQAKLLRVLEDRQVRRVGALNPRPIDVRFVAATHRNLEGEVARGTFRQDLFFRLNGITLTIPPLRERPEEVEALTEKFLAQICAQEGNKRQITLSAEARKLILAYRWPGNVRELKNVIERAALLVRGNVITRDDLPASQMEANSKSVQNPRSTEDSSVPISSAAGPSAPPSVPSAPPSVPSVWPNDSDQTPALNVRGGKASEQERQAIIDALNRCGGNQTKAANLLGISRGTLVARVALYGLPRPRSSGRSGPESE
jgi:two-component system, NtrC family, response regulator AtoC